MPPLQCACRTFLSHARLNLCCACGVRALKPCDHKVYRIRDMEPGARQRRISKRLQAVSSSKRSVAYASCAMRSQTPDPYYHNLSKRRWGKSVMDWRRSFRGQLHGEPGRLDNSTCAPAFEAEPTSLHDSVRSLCGFWVDDKVFTYLLAPGRRNRIDVRTRRPSGRGSLSLNLVRMVETSARESFVWGRCRYNLDHGGPDEVTRQGRAAADVYYWSRSGA